jgi:hypothetical protein
MTKHATNTHATKRANSALVRQLRSEGAHTAARQAQAGFLQGSITSTLLPGASIHSPTGVALGGSWRCGTRAGVQFGTTWRCGSRIRVHL